MLLCSLVTATVPGNPVNNLTAFWKNGVVEISWVTISLFEARVFPCISFHIYTPDSGTMRTINTTNSSIVISGLEPKQSYIFTVQVTGNENNKGCTEYGVQVRIYII